MSPRFIAPFSTISDLISTTQPPLPAQTAPASRSTSVTFNLIRTYPLPFFSSDLVVNSSFSFQLTPKSSMASTPTTPIRTQPSLHPPMLASPTQIHTTSGTVEIDNSNSATRYTVWERLRAIHAGRNSHETNYYVAITLALLIGAGHIWLFYAIWPMVGLVMAVAVLVVGVLGMLGACVWFGSFFL